MTRSIKHNDKPQVALAALRKNDLLHWSLAGGPPETERHWNKYYKAGHGTAPQKAKKNGGGKSNWGEPFEEVLDGEFNFAKIRRRSNSSSNHDLSHFKTKFDVNETEPVFEEDINASPIDDDDLEAMHKTDSAGSDSSHDDAKSTKSI